MTLSRGAYVPLAGDAVEFKVLRLGVPIIQ
jgi:hypothetical protein